MRVAVECHDAVDSKMPSRSFLTFEEKMKDESRQDRSRSRQGPPVIKIGPAGSRTPTGHSLPREPTANLTPDSLSIR